MFHDNSKNDIKRARASRRRQLRVEARRLWMDQLWISFHINWPPSILGTFCGVMLMLSPAIFIFALVRLALLFQRVKPSRRTKQPEPPAA